MQSIQPQVFDREGHQPGADTSLSLSRQLAAWSADTTLIFSGLAVQRAEIAITDVIGCLLGGRKEPAVLNAGRAFAGEGGGASAVTSQVPVAATWAALVNGCAAHVLDFDDNFFPPVTHASAALVPALLALGEEIGARPAAIVRAYIIGLEVQAQIGKRVNPAHYAAGWHATSTIGTLGVAVACAVLLQLDAEGIVHTLSIASSLAGGSKRQFGSMVKPLHAGFAALHGVMAARLAAAGITGVEDTLQGQWSFAQLYAGQPHTVEAPVCLFPDAPLAIEEFGLVAKLYPSCMSSHLGIDALLALRASHAFSVAQIARVDLYLPGFMVANLRYEQPRTPTEARFSMNFCAAVALLDGSPRLGHFSDATLLRPDIQQLMPKVHRHEQQVSPQAAQLPWGGDCLARIALQDGRTLEQHWSYPKGCPQNPLSAEEQWQKFSDCAAGNIGDQALRPLFDALCGFSRLPGLDILTASLRWHS
ncbi:2-methylcitrate dehydratase PrpD [Pseudomonas sp. JUb42]|jgi:2-methylcitrate dehydratase PrpD|uniref:MmgE/PrpD family protein n=1 Tax=Pseudomonas sp. JUb42 TaxID=2940611 RepID=UPI002166E939|nr:MmgE/PrpD family protein [Pseudomonas sp. JUb42]MCS3469062.1 2-methylcitrate dehydratase PrpD [Pseudomonas sp. JUb42]